MSNPTNVRHLGAVGDGKTDDTDAILAAAKEGWISIPPGSYLITRTIELGVMRKVVCEECKGEESDDDE